MDGSSPGHNSRIIPGQMDSLTASLSHFFYKVSKRTLVMYKTCNVQHLNRLGLDFRFPGPETLPGIKLIHSIV
jgi:hypothetical protein